MHEVVATLPRKESTREDFLQDIQRNKYVRRVGKKYRHFFLTKGFPTVATALLLLVLQGKNRTQPTMDPSLWESSGVVLSGITLHQGIYCGRHILLIEPLTYPTYGDDFAARADSASRQVIILQKSKNMDITPGTFSIAAPYYETDRPFHS